VRHVADMSPASAVKAKPSRAREERGLGSACARRRCWIVGRDGETGISQLQAWLFPLVVTTPLAAKVLRRLF
jgi:hypothetical protein